jgi:hypothetical protein
MFERFKPVNPWTISLAKTVAVHAAVVAVVVVIDRQLQKSKND